MISRYMFIQGNRPRDDALAELRDEIISLSVALADVQAQFSMSEEQVSFVCSGDEVFLKTNNI